MLKRHFFGRKTSWKCYILVWGLENSFFWYSCKIKFRISCMRGVLSIFVWGWGAKFWPFLVWEELNFGHFVYIRGQNQKYWYGEVSKMIFFIWGVSKMPCFGTAYVETPFCGIRKSWKGHTLVCGGYENSQISPPFPLLTRIDLNKIFKL